MTDSLSLFLSKEKVKTKFLENGNFCDTHIIVQYTLFYEYKNSMTIFQVRETS